MPAAELTRLIQKVSTGARLATDEIRTALEIMTDGHASPAQMGAFLMALRVRGETVEEITGAAQMMRAKMNRVSAPPGAVDGALGAAWVSDFEAEFAASAPLADSAPAAGFDSPPALSPPSFGRDLPA